MVTKEQGQLECRMRGTSRAVWGAKAGAGGPGQAGRDRGMAKGQAGWAGGTHFPAVCSPSPPSVVWLAMVWWVPAARTAQCWATGAMPCLPVSAWTSLCLVVTLPCAAACTGLSSVNHIAKCLGCVLFVGSWFRAGGCLSTGRAADAEGRQQVYSQLTAQGSIPSQVVIVGAWVLVGVQGWSRCAECPPDSLCPGQPCPAGRSEMGGFLLATSQCPCHVPSSQGP